ncbi:MAG TPA: ATP-binding protein [Gemmatimonadales bacterium]|nr:ATP-binding protein [Gemmatimonadales bacterium]
MADHLVRLLGVLAAYGQELSGALRPQTIVDLLLRLMKQQVAPTAVAVALVDVELNRLQILYPEGATGDHYRPLLDLAMRRGPLLAGDDLPDLLAAARLPALADVPEAYLGVPFRAAGRPIGALVMVGPAGSFHPPDLAFVEAAVAQTSVALENARLVDLLEHRKRSWDATVDAIPQALCIVDRSGRIQRVNRAFAELVRIPPTAIVGRLWLSLVPPAWADALERLLRSAGASPEVELRAHERTFSVTGFPVDSDGAVVLVFDDQTERRRLQSQLIQSEKMSAMGQLIAGIAHDLNNPLASVVGFADFLAESPDVPPRLREPVRVIQQEAERAAKIVRNLLTFARKQEHRRRPTPLRPLLESTVALLRNQLMAHRVDVRVEVEPDLPEVSLDANQIQQVFVNLLNNASQAIDSTGRPGTIIVRARRQGDGVAVDVIDDGPGMPEAVAARVFEPFFTTKPEGHGTGLGLSISQGIVKEHGGRITLSTMAGNGATFTVELPQHGEPVTEPPPPAALRPALPLRILVVDDEPHILHYMRATLEAWGHTVEVASDGAAGLERAAAGGLDLIITDLRMPRLGGREFYQLLAERNPAMARRTVFSTGDTIRGDTLSFLERLGRPFLHKPFGLAELRALLAAASAELSAQTPA